MPSGPEGGADATQGLPAGRDFPPKGPHQKRRFGSFAAAGKGTRRRGGGIPPSVFFPMMERTKDPRGLAPRSASTPVARPRTPVTKNASRKSFREPGAGGSADCRPFRAAAAGWVTEGKPVALDEESAPVATSRRGWSVIGGRRNAAPTQGAPPNPRRNHRIFVLNQVLNLSRRSAASQKAFLPTFFSEKSRRAAPGSSPLRFLGKNGAALLRLRADRRGG